MLLKVILKKSIKRIVWIVNINSKNSKDKI